MFFVFGVFSIYPSLAQQTPAQPPANSGAPAATAPPAATLPDEGNIPEEDEREHHETEYHFNPIRAKKELDTGMFYYHKGSYRAAATRFLEATRWNPGWAEAYLKLGEAQAKLKHKEEARKALAKVMELDPSSKEAKEAKRLTAKL